jgi:hypothetical protein
MRGRGVKIGGSWRRDAEQGAARRSQKDRRRIAWRVEGAGADIGRCSRTRARCEVEAGCDVVLFRRRKRREGVGEFNIGGGENLEIFFWVFFSHFFKFFHFLILYIIR